MTWGSRISKEESGLVERQDKTTQAEKVLKCRFDLLSEAASVFTYTWSTEQHQTLPKCCEDRVFC